MKVGPWFQNKHRRRGRYVDHWCNMIGIGADGPDEAWYSRRSGDPSFNDEVIHEECRPFIEAYIKAKKHYGFKVTHHQVKVRNTEERYTGTLDQIWDGLDVVDIKTGYESDWHWAQVALYQPAALETLGLRLGRWNLYLNPKWKRCPFRLIERKDDIEQAIEIVRAWWRDRDEHRADDSGDLRNDRKEETSGR